MSEALIKMKSYVNKIGLWHSIVHDKDIDENFVADLKLKIDKKYENFDKDWKGKYNNEFKKVICWYNG